MTDGLSSPARGAARDGEVGELPPPALGYETWMTLVAEEQRRVERLLAQLTPGQWRQPTDCDGWDVRAIVCHLAGAAHTQVSVREIVRQLRCSRRLPGTDGIDRMNALQIRERADATPTELRAELAQVHPRALRSRRRLPRPVRAVKVPFGPPLGVAPLGYLYGAIWTRDLWMHRVDICRATEQPLQLTADHDGRLVADVVAEWAALHGRPYRLRLTGPAGGTWSGGRDGESHELDAVEFCRTVSGRRPGSGLLATRVNF